MSAEKRKVKVSYKSNIIRDELEVEPIFQLLRQIPIPDEKHLRSQYFHNVMVAIENCIIEGVMDRTLLYAKEVLMNIEEYVKIKRFAMKKRHRMVSWMIQCRLNCLLVYSDTNDQESNGDDIDTVYLLANKLMISKLHPSNYDLLTLWRALNVLMDGFNHLRYHPSLERYSRSLFLRCASFMFFSSHDKKVFNNQYLTRRLPNGDMCINDNFVLETERIFRDLWERFDRYKSLGPVNVLESYPPNKIQAFIHWINQICSGIFRDFIDKEIREYIYYGYVCISETDRYLDEERDFADPRPYSIVAKYRPHVIDEIAKLLASDKTIETIIERHQESTLTNSVDIDYDMLCCVVLRYYFESVLGSKEEMNEYIITRYSKLTTTKIREQSFQFPLIVQLNNEYGVIYRGSTISYPSADSCVLAWIKTACEDPNINGVMKKGVTTLLDAYDALFPESKHYVKRPEQKNRLQLDLPREYNRIKTRSQTESLAFF